MNKLLISSLAAMMLGAAGVVVAEDTDTHTTHTKAMKEAGAQEGKPMANKAPEAQPAAPATAEEKKAKKHKHHTKAMKETGAQEGKEMSEHNPADAAGPKTAEPVDEKNSHTLHNKQMKEAGHKDGEPMKN